MMSFILKRVLGALAVLLIVSFLVFSLMALSPGSLVSTLLGTAPATPELIQAITEKYHLDEPFLVRYWLWLQGAVVGDFGDSIRSGATVMHDLGAALPLSLQLGGLALLIVVLVGIPLGIAAGLRSGSALDRTVSVLTTFSMSAPVYAVGLVLLYVFGVVLDIFPVFGAGKGFLDRLWHLALPAIALAAMLIAVVMRQTRAAVLDIVNQDFMTFARARGVSKRRIMTQYVLRPASLPIVTAVGVVLIAAVVGAVIVENVFSLPGIGTLLVESVALKDLPVVQAITMFAALFVIVVNFMVDAAMFALDPRTRSAVK